MPIGQSYSTVLIATPIVFRFSALEPSSQSRPGSEPFLLPKKEAGKHFIYLAFICTFLGASVNVLKESESDHQAGEDRSVARTETRMPVDQRAVLSEDLRPRQFAQGVDSMSETTLAAAAIDAALAYFRKHQTTMVEDPESVLPAHLRNCVIYV